ncbi:MAG: pyridoxal phosphate-dependent aminotransferase [Candidatus Acidiferrales bacterium]
MKTEEALRFTARVNRVEVSATATVIAAVERERARGVDLVDFGPGEPDFPTPDNIKRAAIRALDENKTKYTATGGIAPLRQAICDWHKREFGTAYAPAECVVSVGGKHALFNIINALVEEGDEVIVPSPYWVTYPGIVKFAEGKPALLPLSADDNFCLRAAALENAITPQTRLVIVNSPSNPTGAVIPPEEFACLLEVCRRRGIWLLSDECYSHFVYDGARPFSVAGLADAKDHVIIAGSLSKTYAMTGWRIGYALCPAPLAEALVNLQSQATSNPNSIAQYAALEALRGPMDSVYAMLAEYTRRREKIVAGLRAIPGIKCAAPQGAFYVFPDVSAAGGADTLRIARELLERAHVALLPGEAFGAPGFLRLSYATSMERIEEGVRRLAQFFGQAK